MKAKLILVWVTVFLCFGIPKAKAIEFPPDFTITDENYDTVELYDSHFIFDVHWGGIATFPPTVGLMTGGSVGDSDDLNSGVFAYESSAFSVSGGEISYLNAYNTSTVNISGGVITGSGPSACLATYDSSTVNITGGQIGYTSMNGICFNDSSVVNIDMEDGSIRALPEAYNSSTINIYKGSLNYFFARDSSIINIYGGTIEAWGFHIQSTATANIYGNSFNYDPYAHYSEVLYGGWASELTGVGFDGTPIGIIGIPDPYSSSNINLIPEPATFLLLGFGIIFLRKVAAA